MALSQDQGGGDQLLDDKRSWSNQATPAQLVHERPRDGKRV
jgi:hypothetical protein